MTTKRMQSLLDSMNKHAIFYDGCEPSFAALVDAQGDETETTYGDVDDLFIQELMSQGKGFKAHETEVLLCDMPHGRCHLNVLEALEDGETIYTGYAQIAYPDGIGGDWFSHSWIVGKNGEIVETFSQHFPCYFGVPLQGEELKIFTEYTNSIREQYE